MGRKAKSKEHKVLYHCWINMRVRCTNKNHKQYKDYGGRGITVCPEWMDSFEAFYQDMGNKPDASYSLDRIDNDKGYSPDNCRWATRSMQNSNKRNTVHKIVRPRQPIGRPKSTRTCGASGCTNPHYARDFCIMHYYRMERHGMLTIAHPRLYKRVEVC